MCLTYTPKIDMNQTGCLGSSWIFCCHLLVWPVTPSQRYQHKWNSTKITRYWSYLKKTVSEPRQNYVSKNQIVDTGVYRSVFINGCISNNNQDGKVPF